MERPSSSRSCSLKRSHHCAQDAERLAWSPFAQVYDPVNIANINGIGTFAHDRAVIKAMQSKYIPDSSIPDNERLKKTLIIAKLPPFIGEEEVLRLLNNYGKIENVKIIRDLVTKRSKGYGFVEFKKERHCQRAIDDKANLSFGGGKQLVLDNAISRSMPGWKPRRLGGGFGGNQNSGQLRFGCKARPWLFKSDAGRSKKALRN